MPNRYVLIVGGTREAVDRVAPMLQREEIQVVTVEADPAVLHLVLETPFHLVIGFYPGDSLSIPELVEAVRSSGSACRAAGVLVLADPADLEDAERLVDHGVNRIGSLAWTGARLWRVVSDLLDVPPRLELRTLVHVDVEVGDGRGEDICESVNLSSTGMLVRGPVSYAPGTPVSMSFSLPGRPVPINAEAEVVRSATTATNGLGGFAVRFVSMSEEDEERLNSYLGQG